MTLLDIDPKEKSFAPLRESTKRAFKGILSENNISPSREDFQWFKELYYENHKKYIKLFPETFEIIEQIRNNTSIHLGIISDIDNDYMDFQFNVFGIKEMFDSITTSEEFKSTNRKQKSFRLL